MPHKQDTLEVIRQLLLFGFVGALFAFIRLLVTQTARTKTDFFAAIFVGVTMATLVGITLHEFEIVKGVWTYVALAAILSEKIVLLIIKIGAEMAENPQSILKIIRNLLDKK